MRQPGLSVSNAYDVKMIPRDKRWLGVRRSRQFFDTNLTFETKRTPTYFFCRGVALREMGELRGVTTDRPSFRRRLNMAEKQASETDAQSVENIEERARVVL